MLLRSQEIKQHKSVGVLIVCHFCWRHNRDVTSDTCHGSTISSADCLRKLNHTQKVGQLYRSSDAGFSFVQEINKQVTLYISDFAISCKNAVLHQVKLLMSQHAPMRPPHARECCAAPWHSVACGAPFLGGPLRPNMPTSASGHWSTQAKCCHSRQKLKCMNLSRTKEGASVWVSELVDKV